MYNILIYTVTAGNGHNNIASTFAECAKKYYGDDINIKIIKFYNDNEYSSPFRNFIIDDCYRLSVKLALPIYNKTYRVKQVKRNLKRNTFWVKAAITGRHKKVLETIEEFKPDCIFCTHFFPAAVLSDLKRQGKLHVPFVTMLFDYIVTPYIETAIEADLIFVPNEELKQEMLQIGFKESQLKVVGLICKYEVQEIPRPKNKRLTVLIFSGAGSFAGLYKQVKFLLKSDLDIDVLLLNGKDKKKYKKLDKYINKLKSTGKLQKMHVENYGFISKEELFDLYKRADCVVSKTGGNSITEIFNLNRVLIVTDKLAAQEWRNVEYLKSFADCFIINKKEDLTNLLKSGVFTDEFFAKYMQDVKKIQTPGANKRYVDAIIELCKEHQKEEINEETNKISE